VALHVGMVVVIDGVLTLGVGADVDTADAGVGVPVSINVVSLEPGCVTAVLLADVLLDSGVLALAWPSTDVLDVLLMV
jgi:hypothetical protein